MHHIILIIYTAYDKAGALWRSVTLNHPFIDGNKRMGFVCCIALLFLNGYFVIAAQDEVEDMCVRITAGNPAPEVAELANWLRQNTITLDKLARILRAMGNTPSYWHLVGRVLDDPPEPVD